MVQEGGGETAIVPVFFGYYSTCKWEREHSLSSEQFNLNPVVTSWSNYYMKAGPCVFPTLPLFFTAGRRHVRITAGIGL